MNVLEKATMPDGTAIVIEDCRADYDYIPRDELTLAAFPGKPPIRVDFNFKDSHIYNVFAALKDGKSTLKAYTANLCPQNVDKERCL